MAITPRTILTSAAPATVAVVSLYFFTVLGTAAYQYMNKVEDAPEAALIQISPADTTRDACSPIAKRFGGDRSHWTEYAWATYGYCFDKIDDSHGAIAAADEGLRYHPRSEILFNLKAYHQIVLGDHAGAISTLRTGLDQVRHNRNGVMTNNLAWAGLWEPRLVRLDEARELYLASLAKSPRTCETVHTGLFVEFTIANKAHGLERFEALKRFSNLRRGYESCFDRIDNGEWITVVELVGAAVLFNEVDGSQSAQPELRQLARKLVSDHGHVTAREVCAEAMPMADFHHVCVDAIENAVRANRSADRDHAARNQRVRESRKMLEQVDHVPVIRANHRGNRTAPIPCLNGR